MGRHQSTLCSIAIYSLLCRGPSNTKQITLHGTSIPIVHKSISGSSWYETPLSTTLAWVSDTFQFPTVLEVSISHLLLCSADCRKIVARYSVCDERLLQISVYDRSLERSYHFFQLSQAHCNGFGFNFDVCKAHSSHIFSLKRQTNHLIHKLSV